MFAGRQYSETDTEAQKLCSERLRQSPKAWHGGPPAFYHACGTWHGAPGTGQVTGPGPPGRVPN